MSHTLWYLTLSSLFSSMDSPSLSPFSSSVHWFIHHSFFSPPCWLRRLYFCPRLREREEETGSRCSEGFVSFLNTFPKVSLNKRAQEVPRCLVTVIYSIFQLPYIWYPSDTGAFLTWLPNSSFSPTVDVTLILPVCSQGDLNWNRKK